MGSEKVLEHSARQSAARQGLLRSPSPRLGSPSRCKHVSIRSGASRTIPSRGESSSQTRTATSRWRTDAERARSYVTRKPFLERLLEGFSAAEIPTAPPTNPKAKSPTNRTCQHGFPGAAATPVTSTARQRLTSSAVAGFGERSCLPLGNSSPHPCLSPVLHSLRPDPLWPHKKSSADVGITGQRARTQSSSSTGRRRSSRTNWARAAT